MAKTTYRNPVTVTTTAVIKPAMISLELTLDEAEALRSLLGFHVVGSGPTKNLLTYIWASLSNVEQLDDNGPLNTRDCGMPDRVCLTE